MRIDLRLELALRCELAELTKTLLFLFCGLLIASTAPTVRLGCEFIDIYLATGVRAVPEFLFKKLVWFLPLPNALMSF